MSKSPLSFVDQKPGFALGDISDPDGDLPQTRSSASTSAIASLSAELRPRFLLQGTSDKGYQLLIINYQLSIITTYGQ
ncbi:hypothetical protein [[Phormidium] sp. ETS-05]|uniref:hypothetical protein n=1 Tax=[Phormidium] sp. ETS-05 TaxID=222819 RepID=UPI0018EF2F1D|nr:hypothetical protein [[Phormidium] sp. ETS-05]